MEERQQTVRSGSCGGGGYALGALGGTLLLLGTMAILAPLLIGLLGLTLGLGGVWTLVVVGTAGILLHPSHAAIGAVLVGSMLLTVAAWLTRDRQPRA